MSTIIQGEMKALTVRREENRVLLIQNGRVVFDAPYEAALAIARAIFAKAKEAEEEFCVEQIVADQAILTRLGLPFGLTNRPDFLKMAANQAAWNSDLRRYIPPSRAGGMASQAIVGTPKIINHGEVPNGNNS